MKFRIFIVILLVIAAAVVGRRMSGTNNAGTDAGGDTRREIRRSYRLAPGARVEVRHISGTVEIKTAETDTAEVHVVQTANDPEALEYRKVVVENAPDSLVIRGEDQGGRSWWRRLWRGSWHVRQQVKLTIPRNSELAARHVNGPVEVGEIDGAVEFAHVNGRVHAARVKGRTEVSHVNGGVKLGLAQPGEQGLELRHVNGNVEFRLKESLDADISVSRHHGGFALDAPNVTTRERENRSTFRARLGRGGPEINIRHVNGNVRFETNPDAPSAPVAANATLPDAPDAPDAENFLPPPPPPPPAR